MHRKSLFVAFSRCHFPLNLYALCMFASKIISFMDLMVKAVFYVWDNFLRTLKMYSRQDKEWQTLTNKYWDEPFWILAIIYRQFSHYLMYIRLIHFYPSIIMNATHAFFFLFRSSVISLLKVMLRKVLL